MTIATERGRRWRRIRRPPSHWVALVLLLASLVLMTATDALLDPGEAEPLRKGAPALDPTSPAGGVLDLAGPTLRTARGSSDVDQDALVIVGLPSRSRDLDELLDVVERERARGTWFLSGRMALDNPRAVQRVRDAGFELGVIGFSGRDLRGLPPWRIRLELSVTQAVLAANQGITAPLLLVPETPKEVELDSPALRVGRTAAEHGYVLTAGATSATPAGAIVIHDLRSATSTRDLIASIESGRWTTVSDLTRLRSEEVNRPAPPLARINGRIVVATVAVATVVIGAVGWLFFPVTGLIVLRALAATILASLHWLKTRKPIASPWTGPVTVVVPAYNEAAGIEPALRSIVGTDWEHGVEVIVVDDGSTDGTADIVRDLALDGVRLIRQRNAGKPAALNTGAAASSTEIVVFVDGDTLFQRDTIAEIVAPFCDAQIGAVSGNAKVLNRKSLLGKWQHIEYVMGFNLDRRLLDLLNAIPTVPGAIGGFRRAALSDVGHVSDDTIAEDTDLTIALARRGWRIVYRPQAIAWTEAPSTIGDLWRQRYRWSYGTMQASWKHRRALIEPRPIGPVGLTYALVFQVMLAVLGPVLDVAALAALASDQLKVALVWLGFNFVQLLLAAFAFKLDRESLRPLWALPFQQFLYRQLMYLVVIQSVITAFAGNRLRWQKLKRVGLEGHGVDIAPQP